MAVFNVGALGTRRDYTYDINSDVRKLVRQTVTSILQEYREYHEDLYGYSGLNIGLEQDFLACCLNLHIPYTIVLPYKASVLITPSEMLNDYIQHLIDNAKDIISLSDNIFSVRKNLAKKEKIIKLSDVIITNDSKIECKKRLLYV